MYPSILELKKYTPHPRREERFEKISPRKIPKDQYFLRGPIPMEWLYETMQLSGKCLHIGIELLFWSGIRGRTDEIKFSCSQLRKRGISRYSALRALNKLERAELISTKRKPGSKIIVKINLPESWVRNRPTLHNVNNLEN